MICTHRTHTHTHKHTHTHTSRHTLTSLRAVCKVWKYHLYVSGRFLFSPVGHSLVRCCALATTPVQQVPFVFWDGLESKALVPGRVTIENHIHQHTHTHTHTHTTTHTHTHTHTHTDTPLSTLSHNRTHTYTHTH